MSPQRWDLTPPDRDPAAASDHDDAGEPGGGGTEAFVQLVRHASVEGASDIHLRAGSAPRLRIHGELLPVRGFTPSDARMREWFRSMVSAEQWRNFERVLELDFSRVIPGVCRMRVNLFFGRDQFCAAVRLIPGRIPSMEELGLPAAVARLAEQDRGLILVTGPTGSGKSTTLAAMIDHINRTRRCHILTIEDPIEYHHEEKRAYITQRELDRDTRTFVGALRHSFRQDPDVVLIGEMRDQDTMQTALTLAETGHLTLSTLHTGDAVQTVSRIVDAMPPHNRDQIRTQLAASLDAAIAQRLLPRSDGSGRVAAREIMVCNHAIRNLIREGRMHQIHSSIQTGVEEGMITMNASLAELVSKNSISTETAQRASDDPKDLMTRIGGIRLR